MLLLTHNLQKKFIFDVYSDIFPLLMSIIKTMFLIVGQNKLEYLYWHVSLYSQIVVSKTRRLICKWEFSKNQAHWFRGSTPTDGQYSLTVVLHSGRVWWFQSSLILVSKVEHLSVKKLVYRLLSFLSNNRLVQKIF